MAAYSIIDVDTHVTEAADVWTARAPASMRERVPRVAQDDRVGRRRPEQEAGRATSAHEADCRHACGPERLGRGPHHRKRRRDPRVQGGHHRLEIIDGERCNGVP